MDGRRRAAWVAIVVAASCGSSGEEGPLDAAVEAAIDGTADAPATPADASGACAVDPDCGVHAPERVTDCLYMLPKAPPVPSDVGVYFVGDGGMMKIPWDTEERDGWDYVDGTATSIRLYGGWCDDDRSGMFGTVMIIAGCPGICVP
ncbi:MAG TPA: hypothetical protein VHL80_14650 [Polyangia bacterium]|nr:hypothetical protein [Polyangia bacterium]